MSFFSGCSKTPSELKTIQYRGGIASFRIPSHWHEDYLPDGGADFYAETPGAPTFRLSTITAKTPYPVTTQSSSQILSGLSQASHGIEPLPNGLALIRYTEPGDDRGQKLLITYWLIAQPIPPAHARIAIFSFTILENQRSDQKIQSTLQFLDREVRAATFAPELRE